MTNINIDKYAELMRERLTEVRRKQSNRPGWREEHYLAGWEVGLVFALEKLQECEDDE